MTDEFIEIDRGDTVWRFEREFLESNWTCLFGKGCKGILTEPAEELNQGCCSLGAHFGDGPAGQAESKEVLAYASMLTPENFQHFDQAHEADTPGMLAIYGDDGRTHTRLVDNACIFLNRPGFAGGEGCALHIAAIELTSHRRSGSHRCAGNCRCVSTGKKSMPTPRPQLFAAGPVPTGASTARRWRGAAPSDPTAARRIPAPSK